MGYRMAVPEVHGGESEAEVRLWGGTELEGAEVLQLPAIQRGDRSLTIQDGSAGL